MLARYEYDPYGRRTRTTGTQDADFGFTGHYYHAPTGLHLALYRAYDADLSRWLNRDPIGEQGGVNLYGYVGNGPINVFDPLGLWNAKNLIGGGAAGLAAYALLGIAAAAVSPVVVVAAGIGAGVAATLALANLAAGAFEDKPVNIPTGPFQLCGQMMDHGFDPSLTLDEVGPSQRAGLWADYVGGGGMRLAGQLATGTGFPGGLRATIDSANKSVSPPSPIVPPPPGPWPKPTYP